MQSNFLLMETYEIAMGSILGAFVGDAAGAPLEFAASISDEDVADAMAMKGGGLLDIGKGQITDDSELAMCQLQILSIYKPHNPHHIASLLLDKYREWYHSKPFDIGSTTINALGRYQNIELEEHLKRVAKVNKESKSNGALMKMTPLAVWTRNLEYIEKLKIIANDTRMTHPNQSCVEASIVYCLAIHALFERPGDTDFAMQEVMKYLDTIPESEVRTWIIEEGNKDWELYDVKNSIGYVRWALTMAFYHLQQKTPYRDAIEMTLLKGGDTDTNAAIVGGLVGALHGRSAIPIEMQEAVVGYEYDPEAGIGFDRPEFVSPNDLEKLVEKLVKIS